MLTQKQKQEITEEVHKWVKKGNEIFGLNLPMIRVCFALSGGSVAGYFYAKSVGNFHDVIRLNPQAFELDWNYSINQLIPHEVAHYVQYIGLIGRSEMNKCRWKNGRRYRTHKPHEEPWKRVMKVFGKDAVRCNTLDLKPARKTEQFIYGCGCSPTKFNLGKTRHNKNEKYILKTGKSWYFCKTCKKDVVFNMKKEFT